jgi:fimbrial chaperone protein
MKSNLARHERLLLVFCLVLIAVPAARATGFAATVSPPRFELRAQPGEVLREVVEISNTDTMTASYDLRSADWDLSADGGVTIHPPARRPGSCRDWTRIERHNIRLPAQGERRFRFEIHVPKDAQTGECRVALLLEGGEEEQILAGTSEIRFPVQGRIAIIIYVAVGAAKPELSLLELGMGTVNSQRIPVAVLANTGNAHGRPSGFLDGVDAVGNRLEFTVSPSPILPGQQRRIPIWPASTNRVDAAGIVLPLKLTGSIEWEGGKKKISETISPTHRIGLAE